ncbi:MAG TPA: hypothetical protein VIF62_20195, partial [Labilithrix sp.]
MGPTSLTLAGKEISVGARGGGRHEIGDGVVTLRGTIGDDALELVVRHAIAHARHVWVPHLTPAEGNVAGDAVLRAPAVVVADEEVAIAFIVDVGDLARAKGFRAWLDYDHPNRTLVLGAGAYRASGHVFFVREPPSVSGASVELRLHVLASRRAEDLANPYGMAARFLWSARERSEPRPLAPLMDHVLRWAFASGWTESVWQDVDADRGAPVFIVDVTRHPSVPLEERTWREPRSIWNQAWFSTQRCANGLLRHARRTRDEALERRAHRMTNVALSAPQDDGLFPSVLRHEGDAWRWTNSDRRPPGVSERAIHIV